MRVMSKVSVLALLVIMAVTSSCSNNSVPRFWLNDSSMSSLPEDQEIYLGDRAKMELGKVFIWVSKNSGPYLPHLKPGNNSCSAISFEQTSFDDGSVVFRTSVIICNRSGQLYYIVPIVS